MQTVNSTASFPALLTAELELEMESPPDTFLDMTVNIATQSCVLLPLLSTCCIILWTVIHAGLG